MVDSKRTLMFLAALASLSFLIAFAQSKPEPKTPRQSGSRTMNCPMMGMMAGMLDGQMSNGASQMMKNMTERITQMFSPSAEEITALLAENKAGLGLSDEQAKRIGELMASWQRREAAERMQRMMDRMRAQGMRGPAK